jgi:hypothetical protein
LSKARIVTLALAVAAALVLSGCSSFSRAVINQVAELSGTTDEQGVFSDAGNTDFYELTAGMCVVDDVNLDTRLLSFTTDDCTEPHTAEVYAVFDVADPGAVYPGDDAVDDAAWEGCESRFAGYVATDYESSVLDIVYWVPDDASFALDDRSVICMAYTYYPGSLTESVEGSGQ